MQRMHFSINPWKIQWWTKFIHFKLLQLLPVKPSTFFRWLYSSEDKFYCFLTFNQSSVFHSSSLKARHVDSHNHWNSRSLPLSLFRIVALNCPVQSPLLPASALLLPTASKHTHTVRPCKLPAVLTPDHPSMTHLLQCFIITLSKGLLQEVSKGKSFDV